MKRKQHDTELKDATAFLQRIKFNAYTERLACAKTENPFIPISGMENDFDAATATISRVNFILGELDKRIRIKRKAVRIFGKLPEALLFTVFTFGFMLLVWLGVSFIGLYFDVKPVVTISSLLFVAVVAEMISRFKARKRRK